jgi:hypothetical protein
MQNCKHCVVFKTYKRESVGLDSGTTWEITATCPICCSALSGEVLRTALSRLYSDGVTELIFAAFENNQRFLTLATNLSHMGIGQILGLFEMKEDGSR